MKRQNSINLFTALIGLSGLLVPSMAQAQDYLLVPDSIRDRILLFDPFDGSLVDNNFIDGDGIFTTPLNAIQVNEEIWVSDLAADTIFRFDLKGQSLGSISGGLDNIRGMEFINDTVYVSNAGTNNGAPGDGEVVVTFDTQGNNTGFFDTGDPFDIFFFNGELLISDINRDSDGGEDIDRYDLAGNFLGTFVESDGLTGIDFPQQINQLSNGNLLIAGFSAPGGLYEFDATGAQVRVLDADDGFANIVRAGYELGNGNILWSGGDGIVSTNPNTGAFKDIYTVNTLDFRPSTRYIELATGLQKVPEPTAGTLSLLALLCGWGLTKKST
ncbi:MAG: hypothetical protein AAGG02_15335 [Cyanobacteria bacterium P01_H01_bin.15]